MHPSKPTSGQIEGMNMTNTASADQYIGRRAVDPHGSKIGSVGQVYLDDETGQPDWITVNTGLFATQENFVPLRGARIDGDDLVLPFDTDVVKNSPQIADSSHLDTEDEESLYAYYEPYLSVETPRTPETRPHPPQRPTPASGPPVGTKAGTRPGPTPTKR